MSIIGPNTRKATTAPGVNIDPSERTKKASTVEQIAITNARPIRARTDHTGFCPRNKSKSRYAATWMKPATAHPTTKAGSITLISTPNMRTAWRFRSWLGAWLCTLQES